MDKQGLIQYFHDLFKQLSNPWFWFGVSAQGLFFLRFFWQWIVSERNQKSTIPVAFWYFSIAGAMCTFIYAAGKRDLAIMLGQMPACFFYTRNLMLIRRHWLEQKKSGFPIQGTSES